MPSYILPSNPSDAFVAVESAVAVTMTAVVAFRPLRPWPASVLFVSAVWMAALAPWEPALATGLGAHTGPQHLHSLLSLSACIATAAMLVARPHWVALFALVGQWALWKLSAWVGAEADWELSAAYVVWFGILYGAHLQCVRGFPGRPLPMPTTARPKMDAAIFVSVAALTALVSTYVLLRSPTSGDEWANLYQADLFAQFKAYTTPPPCSRLFQNFWVFYYNGRAFSQYTPGWPLVIAPFERFGIPWLVNPIVTGVMAVGVARLTRRVVATGMGGVDVPTERHVQAAGILGAVMAGAGASMVLNGSSLYAHPLVCACFAWAIEAVCAMSSVDTPERARHRWGVVLGVSVALMATARPGEGALLGTGIFLYFVYALVRRRIALKSFVATALPVALIMGLTLVILRLQLGVWFKTGYSITTVFHGWAKLDLSPATPGQIKHVFPLANGSVYWWPAAPALGMAGLCAARGASWRAAVMLTLGPLVLLGFLFYANSTHQQATGFGPRFHLPVVVSLAVGGGALLAPLWASAWRRFRVRSAITVGGPAALTAVAIIAGVVRVAPLIYPEARADMMRKTAPFRAIRAANLHNAVVTVTRHEVDFDPMDLTQNLPHNPLPDVLVLHDCGVVDIECGMRKFPDRYWYHAKGIDEATLTPLTVPPSVAP